MLPGAPFRLVQPGAAEPRGVTAGQGQSRPVPPPALQYGAYGAEPAVAQSQGRAPINLPTFPPRRGQQGSYGAPPDAGQSQPTAPGSPLLPGSYGAPPPYSAGAYGAPSGPHAGPPGGYGAPQTGGYGTPPTNNVYGAPPPPSSVYGAPPHPSGYSAPAALPRVPLDRFGMPVNQVPHAAEPVSPPPPHYAQSFTLPGAEQYAAAQDPSPAGSMLYGAPGAGGAARSRYRDLEQSQSPPPSQQQHQVNFDAQGVQDMGEGRAGFTQSLPHCCAVPK